MIKNQVILSLNQLHITLVLRLNSPGTDVTISLKLRVRFWVCCMTVATYNHREFRRARCLTHSYFLREVEPSPLFLKFGRKIVTVMVSLKREREAEVDDDDNEERGKFVYLLSSGLRTISC